MITYIIPKLVADQQTYGDVSLYNTKSFQLGLAKAAIDSISPYIQTKLPDLSGGRIPNASQLDLNGVSQTLATQYNTLCQEADNFYKIEPTGQFRTADLRYISTALNRYLRLSRDIMATKASRLHKLSSGILSKLANAQWLQPTKQ